MNERMMQKPFTRFIYFGWKYYSFKLSIILGTIFWFSQLFLIGGSGRGMSGTTSGTTREHYTMLKESGFIDTVMSWNKAIYDFIATYMNIGELANYFLMMFIFGSILSLLMGIFVWFGFELAYFLKVHVFKQDKKKAFEEIKKRLKISMQENQI